MNFEEKKVFLINVSVLAVTFLITVAVSRFLFVYLLPFVIGTVLAFAVQKPAEWLSVRCRLSCGVIAAFLVAVLYLLGAGLFSLIIWKLFSGTQAVLEGIPEKASQLMPQIESIIQRITGMTKHLSKAYGETVDLTFQNTLQNIFDRIMDWFSSTAGTVISKIPSVLFSTVVTVAASCYIAKDFQVLTKFIKGFLRPKSVEKIVCIRNIFTDDILKFVLGYLILAVITMAELSLGFLLLRVRHAFLIALLTVFVDILPVLGSGTVLLPWSVFAFIGGDVKRGSGLLILYVVITVIRYFIEPKVVGSQLGIRPIFMLFVMFVGLKISGLGGLILFPIIFIVVIDYYKLQIQEDNRTFTNG